MCSEFTHKIFHKNPRNRDGPVALLQLATFDGESTKCFLFRLCKFNINESEELVKLLHSDEHVNLGVGIVGDIKRLRKDYSLGLEYSRNLDLRYLTKAWVLGHFQFCSLSSNSWLYAT